MGIATPQQNSGWSKVRQRRLTASRNGRLDELRSEQEHIQVGEVEILVHALVVPVQEHGGA